MEISRNQLQEKCMVIIYEYLTFISMGKEINVESTISEVLQMPYEECPEYVKQVCLNVIIHFNEMVEIFDANLNKWRFSRLNRCAQAILLLSYASFKYVGQIEKAIVINIAVKLAKSFADTNDFKYINAVLDKIL